MSSIITSDYSTPRTTRGPISARARKRRITHLIYRPLELDTESSSESNENNFRRKKLKKNLPRSRSATPTANSITLDIPAIEYNVTTPTNLTITSAETPKTTPQVEVITISESESTQTTILTYEPTNASSKSGVVDKEPVVANSEPPTPPVTPEKAKEEISSFVPGNIWIFKMSQEK